MATGKEQYVYRLMKAKCTCGSKDFAQKLNLKEDHGIIFNDYEYPLMNANDHKAEENIFSFGRCKKKSDPILSSLFPGVGFFLSKLLVGGKCQPLTPSSWIYADDDYYIDGAPALTIHSVLNCAYGGEISITLEVEKVADDSAESTETAEETPPEEEKDKKEQLPSEVQEKIDSFTDDKQTNPQNRGTDELLIGDVSFTTEEALKEKYKMFQRYSEDVTDVQINENYSE